MQERVTINERGVITIPVKMRQAFGLKAHDELIIEQNEQGIILRPSVVVPIEIYSEERIAEFSSDEKNLGPLLQADD